MQPFSVLGLTYVVFLGKDEDDRAALTQTPEPDRSTLSVAEERGQETPNDDLVVEENLAPSAPVPVTVTGTEDPVAAPGGAPATLIHTEHSLVPALEAGISVTIPGDNVSVAVKRDSTLTESESCEVSAALSSDVIDESPEVEMRVNRVNDFVEREEDHPACLNAEVASGCENEDELSIDNDAHEQSMNAAAEPSSVPTVEIEALPQPQRRKSRARENQDVNTGAPATLSPCKRRTVKITERGQELS